MGREPVQLISRWPLKGGMTTDLRAAIVELANSVRRHEPGTLSYEVFAEASDPLSRTAHAEAKSPDARQRNVTFVEAYADQDAFDAHLKGDAFTTFRVNQLHHFQESPTQPGWPASSTEFLTPVT